MYRRASEDNLDVLIADATVFYEDSKNFGRLFDHSIRRTLDPRLRTMPFDLRSEPRVSVAGTCRMDQVIQALVPSKSTDSI